MISTILLSILLTFLTFITGLLPIGHLPGEMTTAFAFFFGIANQFTYVFPIYTLMQALAVFLIFDGVVLLWHFVQWIIRKIPGMQ
jgi:hypothetical protein